MARRKLSKVPRTIKGQPQSQQAWEEPKAYNYFLEWLNGQSVVDVALNHEISVGYVEDLRKKNQWERRRTMIEGMQTCMADHLTIPESDLQPVEGEPDDTIVARVSNADDVLFKDYQKTVAIHNKLIQHVEDALENVDTKKLSVSEVRALCSTAKDLGELKNAQLKDLMGLEQLAEAILEIQRKKGKK